MGPLGEGPSDASGAGSSAGVGGSNGPNHGGDGGCIGINNSNSSEASNDGEGNAISNGVISMGGLFNSYNENSFGQCTEEGDNEENDEVSKENIEKQQDAKACAGCHGDWQQNYGLDSNTCRTAAKIGANIVGVAMGAPTIGIALAAIDTANAIDDYEEAKNEQKYYDKRSREDYPSYDGPYYDEADPPTGWHYEPEE